MAIVGGGANQTRTDKGEGRLGARANFSCSILTQSPGSFDVSIGVLGVVRGIARSLLPLNKYVVPTSAHEVLGTK